MPATAGRASAGSVFGWVILLLVLAVVGFVGYRMQHYYRLLQSGQIVELPQDTVRLTTPDGSRVSKSRVDVQPDYVVSSNDQALGLGEGADLTVVMFGDYECAYSREMSTVFRRMAAKYGSRVRFVYRDYPLSTIHPRAYDAAVAAECAGEQMSFWSYFDRLYSSPDELEYEDLLRHGTATGLEPIQFERCLEDGRYAPRVDEDVAAAQALGLRGTPSLFLNGRRIEGAISEPDLEKAIEKMLK